MDLNAWPQRTACSSSDAEPHTGTTIVACTYNGGVVIGADGRVSTGNYISNRASNKISRLTDSVFLLRSGSAADTQAVGDYGKSTLLQWMLQVAVAVERSGEPQHQQLLLIASRSQSATATPQSHKHC